MDDLLKARILIIDDSRSIREEIKDILKKARPEATFYEAENGLDGFRILVDRPVDLILCDLVMPEMDGFKFLQMRASRPELQGIPVIILTAVGDVDQKIKILSTGAGDYVTKPFHPGELVARALVHLNIKLLQDELRRKNELLLDLSTTDSLTKIYNRRHFLELARHEFDRCDRQDMVASLMIFDVDRFKEINDTLGHHVGDEVLIALCDYTRTSLREYDVLGRYGGDEFTLLLPQTETQAALAIGNRLETGIQAMRLPCLKGTTVTISGGIATKRGVEDKLEAVLKVADQALYEAKRLGRARIVAH